MTPLPARAHVIGIDGGQTGTTCLIARCDGAIIGRGQGGHLIHLAQPQGEATMSAAIATAVSQAWQVAGLAPQPCAAAYLGLSGVEAAGPEAGAARRIAAAVIDAPQITAANDATNALAGALLGKPGVVVIGGTGAIARGANERGDEAFSGGWGWLLGDEGSAAYLGRSGLLAAIRAWDGRGPQTVLQPAVAQRYGLGDFFDLKRIIYGSPPEARLFADLAPLVAQAASRGDRVAALIMRDGAHELAAAASAVIHRLAFTSTVVPVAPLGGVWRAGSLILRPFRARLRRLAPRASLVKPALPAACGALILALRACDCAGDDAIGRLQRDARRRGWANVE